MTTFKRNINHFFPLAGLTTILNAYARGLVFTKATSLFIIHTNGGSQIFEYFSCSLNRYRHQPLWLVKTPGQGDR